MLLCACRCMLLLYNVCCYCCSDPLLLLARVLCWSVLGLNAIFSGMMLLCAAAAWSDAQDGEALGEEDRVRRRAAAGTRMVTC